MSLIIIACLSHHSSFTKNFKTSKGWNWLWRRDPDFYQVRDRDWISVNSDWNGNFKGLKGWRCHCIYNCWWQQ